MKKYGNKLLYGQTNNINYGLSRKNNYYEIGVNS